MMGHEPQALPGGIERLLLLRLRARGPEVADDLAALHERWVDRYGGGKARWMCWREALNICVFGLGKAPIKRIEPGGFWMLNSYLKSAFRTVNKHRGFAFLNVLGLATGMAAALLILQYVSFETGYDDFPGADRLYRIQNNYIRHGELVYNSAGTFPGVGPTLKNSLPEVEDYTRLYHPGAEDGPRHFTMTTADTEPPVAFNEPALLFADASFLRLFAVRMLGGDAATALLAPNSIALSASAARRYFGDVDPVGRTLRLHNDRIDAVLCTVTGVFADPPDNTHLPYQVLVSFNTLSGADGFESKWNGPAAFHTYLKLAPGASPGTVLARLPEFVDRYKPDYLALNDRGERMRRNEFTMLPVGDVHLTSNLHNDLSAGGNGEAVHFLSIVACLILAIAWVNYVNLSTARAVQRAKEVGIRKVLGSTRVQLVKQFLLESGVLNLVSLALALLLAVLAQPLFSRFSGHSSPLFSQVASAWYGLAVLFCAGVLLSGAYPAFVLSAFTPATVLKGRPGRSAQRGGLRRVLVVLQFAAAVVLIVGTFTVYRQLAYMRGQDLGFDVEQVLVLEGPDVFDADASVRRERVEAFKAALAAYPAVAGVAGSDIIPGQGILRGLASRRGTAPTDNGTPPPSIEGIEVDESFIEVYGMDLLAGRNFSKDFADSTAVVFNETAIRQLGFEAPEAALEQTVYIAGDPYSVIGVIRDYHQESLHRMYDPMYFVLSRQAGDAYFSVKIQTRNPAEALARVRAIYETHFPGNPFGYFFLDDFFDAQYRSDQAFGALFRFFAGLAAFIACLGLYGLSAYMTLHRTREIGIRKVMGASAGRILALLTREFVLLVLAATLLALPPAYLALRAWLDNYAFRIAMDWTVFAVPALLVLLIALLSVSYQIIKAARLNPAETLRAE